MWASTQLLWVLIPLSVIGEPTVQFAAVIFRHGARTPVDPYANDPWRNESLWPVPFGELTNEGKLQHYRLGQWLRRRYASLLSTRFDQKEIYLQSTSVDRAIMSVLANSAGLYPPEGQDVWDPELTWQPIPIRTTPDVDEVLTMNKPCHNYQVKLAQYKRSPTYQQELAKYADLMKFLSNAAGQKVTTFDDIEFIYSDLCIERQNNFTLPSWTEGVFPERMQEPACYSFTINSATADLARLKTGPLLKQIAGDMRRWSEGAKSARRVYVYSGHDTTIANVLNSLSLFDVHCPPFTATVLIEIVTEESGGEYKVRVSYRNSTAIVEPRVLTVPGCGELCPLDRFLELYKHLTSVQWELECTQKSVLYPWAFLLGACGAVFLAYICTSKLYFTRARIVYQPQPQCAKQMQQFI